MLEKKRFPLKWMCIQLTLSVAVGGFAIWTFGVALSKPDPSDVIFFGLPSLASLVGAMIGGFFWEV